MEGSCALTHLRVGRFVPVFVAGELQPYISSPKRARAKRAKRV
jgi:hypothetical protein